MKLSSSRRIQKIMAELQRNGFVKASELADRFQVSMETIRKDLLELEHQGIVRKEYGGASLIPSDQEMPMPMRRKVTDSVDAIARACARQIGGTRTLILDAGSTTLALVPFLNRMPEMDIFTNSLEAASLLDGRLHSVYVIPGRKREKNESLTGDWATQFVSRIHAEALVMGTSGVLEAKGPTCHSYQELNLKKAMMAQSDRTIVLAGSGKWREHGLHLVCSWDEVDMVITDEHIPDSVLNHLEEETEVVIAGLDEED